MKCSVFIVFGLLVFTVKGQDSLLTAQEAVDIALQNNLRIQVAQSDLDIARINNNWGNAGKWPTVNATLSNSESITNLNQELSNGSEIKRNAVTNNNLNANLIATWRIYNGMRVRATKERFDEIEKIGEISLKQEITQVSFDVLVAYYNLVRLNQQVKATAAIIELSRERFKIAETRFNVGSAAKTDMLQAGIDLNEQEVNLYNIQRQIRQTKASLNNLLKRDQQTPLEAADTSFNIQVIDIREYRAKTDSQNFQLLLAQRDRAVLIQERRIINSQRLPVLSLNTNTNFTRTKASGGFFLTNQTYGPTVGLGLGIPIYNSNIFKTQLKVNEVQQKQQAVLTELLRNELQRDLQVAYEEYANAMTVAEVERKNTELAEENNKIATAQFRSGQSNSIELRQAQLSLSEAQDRFINARFRAKLAAASIQLIAGEVYAN
jgi:outer membrane protein TolC